MRHFISVLRKLRKEIEPLEGEVNFTKESERVSPVRVTYSLDLVWNVGPDGQVVTKPVREFIDKFLSAIENGVTKLLPSTTEIEVGEVTFPLAGEWTREESDLVRVGAEERKLSYNVKVSAEFPDEETLQTFKTFWLNEWTDIKTEIKSRLEQVPTTVEGKTFPLVISISGENVPLDALVDDITTKVSDVVG